MHPCKEPPPNDEPEVTNIFKDYIAYLKVMKTLNLPHANFEDWQIQRNMLECQRLHEG